MKQETIDQVMKFRDDRNWKQFHNPKDLDISLSLEAGAYFHIGARKMRELFQKWMDQQTVI